MRLNNPITSKSALAIVLLAVIMLLGAHRVIASCCGDFAWGTGARYSCQESSPLICRATGEYCIKATCIKCSTYDIHGVCTLWLFYTCPFGCDAPCADWSGNQLCCPVPG
jgi:hypothetical protein